jgi:hypothetical protein
VWDVDPAWLATAEPAFRADAFENLLGLIFVVVWILGGLLKSRERPSQKAPQVPQPSGGAATSPEEQVRRLLEELTGEPVAPEEVILLEPASREPPPPEPVTVEMPAPSRVEPAVPKTAPELRVPEPQVTVETVMPLAEETSRGPGTSGAAPLRVWVRQAAPRAVLPASVFRGMPASAGALRIFPSLDVTTTGRRPWKVRELLNSPTKLRAAMVLQTVLGKPRALEPFEVRTG